MCLKYHTCAQNRIARHAPGLHFSSRCASSTMHVHKIEPRAVRKDITFRADCIKYHACAQNLASRNFPPDPPDLPDLLRSAGNRSAAAVRTLPSSRAGGRDDMSSQANSLKSIHCVSHVFTPGHNNLYPCLRSQLTFHHLLPLRNLRRSPSTYSDLNWFGSTATKSFVTWRP